MPAASSTDTAKPAQGKVIVSLPADTAHDIDTIGLNIAAAVEEQTGVAVELSRAQVIQACVKATLAKQDEIADAAESGDATDEEE